MAPEESQLTEITLVIVAALAGGLGLARLKQPPVLGYILAGILLGPSGLGLVTSRSQVSTLAELGVLLLLFVVGMELSLRSFKKVWVTASLCTVAQVAISVCITLGVSRFFGWSFSLSLLLGFVAALSSTAVVVRMMEGIGELKTDLGQLTIGILIAQDLAIVPMILILRNVGGEHVSIAALISKMILAIGLITGLIIYLSRRQRVRLPLTQIIAGEKELIPLASLTFCFGAAAVSGLMDLSPAYGAFLAGLTLGNTHERGMLLETTKPIQSLLMMAFFLSIGLLLDLHFVGHYWGSVLCLLLILTIGKTALNIGLLRILRLPWSQAFLVGVVLAQLGEFSFLMATVSLESGIINETGQKLIITVTVLSLALSPLWMASARRLKILVDETPLSLSHVLNAVYGREFLWLRRFWGKHRWRSPQRLPRRIALPPYTEKQKPKSDEDDVL